MSEPLSLRQRAAYLESQGVSVTSPAERAAFLEGIERRSSDEPPRPHFLTRLSQAEEAAERDADAEHEAAILLMDAIDALAPSARSSLTLEQAISQGRVDDLPAADLEARAADAVARSRSLPTSPVYRSRFMELMAALQAWKEACNRAKRSSLLVSVMLSEFREEEAESRRTPEEIRQARRMRESVELFGDDGLSPQDRDR